MFQPDGVRNWRYLEVGKILAECCRAANLDILTVHVYSYIEQSSTPTNENNNHDNVS